MIPRSRRLFKTTLTLKPAAVPFPKSVIPLYICIDEPSVALPRSSPVIIHCHGRSVYHICMYSTVTYTSMNGPLRPRPPDRPWRHAPPKLVVQSLCPLMQVLSGGLAGWPRAGLRGRFYSPAAIDKRLRWGGTRMLGEKRREDTYLWGGDRSGMYVYMISVFVGGERGQLGSKMGSTF